MIVKTEKWLSSLDAGSPKYEHQRLEGLWLHQNHNVVNESLLKQVLRSPDFARAVAGLQDLQVFSTGLRRYVPLGDVVDGFDVVTEESAIAREDRIRTLTVSANPIYGQNSVDAFRRVRPGIENIELPSGYRFEGAFLHVQRGLLLAREFRERGEAAA